MKPPQNVAFLDRALRALSKTNEESVQMRRVMANVIVGQFMEGAVMRGGGSLKLRYGLGTTRYTMDFDAMRSAMLTLLTLLLCRKMYWNCSEN